MEDNAASTVREWFGGQRVDGKGVREWLAEHGATQQQVNSKVVDMVVMGITDGEVSASETARGELDAIAAKAKRTDREVGRLIRDVAKAEERMRGVEELLEVAEAGVDGMTIANQAVTDGVVAFGYMLAAVTDTFGLTGMSDEVKVAAIEAASYGAWSAVMGPRDKDKDKGKGRVVL